MNAERIQAWIDELHGTSGQQWMLRLVVVLAPLGALAAVTAEVGRWWPFGGVLMGALAIAAAFRPDSHTALLIIAVVVCHVLATVEQVDSPWVVVVACCLLLHHSAVALTASFPVGGVVPTATLLRWAQRTGVAGGLTIGMWGLVIVMERRDAAGNGLLTALAVAIVAASAVVIRSRSLNG
ncbi:hypothetical protein [Ilumatobacter sp.]|uniref:hypothetical protein n=1 Tax=Ilumatobacter sp. TaxID=1967498 RepID=UPI003C36BBF6